MTLLFVSCKKKDPCEDVTCYNGTCVEGVCQCEDGFSGKHCERNNCLENCEYGTCDGSICKCDQGYEGIFCTRELNDKFVGNFNLTATCNPNGGGTFPVYLTDYPFAHMDFNIRNLLNDNLTVAAHVFQEQSRRFTIEDAWSYYYYLSGTGVIDRSFDTIRIDYVYGSPGNINTCSAVLARL